VGMADVSDIVHAVEDWGRGRAVVVVVVEIGTFAGQHAERPTLRRRGGMEGGRERGGEGEGEVAGEVGAAGGEDLSAG